MQPRGIPLAGTAREKSLFIYTINPDVGCSSTPASNPRNYSNGTSRAYRCRKYYANDNDDRRTYFPPPQKGGRGREPP